MEYVFNHSLSQQDTSGAPDRRVRSQRPQSAFIPTTSYYAQREDDVGKPVLQHRPLAKGEHTQASLAKVWDDPAQRPKQFLSNDVNKVSYALMSRDIEGAVSRSAEVPQRPRDTNPCAPTYILPGHTANAAATAAAMAASSQPAGNSPSGRPPPGPSAPSTTSSGGGAPPATTASPTPAGASPGRSSAWQDVSDITAVASVVERPARLGTRHTNLSTADIEGAWPHWEPPFRAHVGRNLRDPGLDVSDITGAGGGGEGGIRGAGARRRAASARTARDYGTSRDYGAFYHAPPDQRGDAPRQTYVPPAEAPQPYSPRQQQTAAVTTYLPPPLSWQPVEPPQPSSTAPSGPAGPTGTLAEGEGGGSPASGASPRGPPPAAHSLLLRSASSSGPPYATHIPGGGLAATLAASLGLAPADRAVAAAELPAATVGRPSPARSDPALRHSIKRAASEAQRAAGADAARLVAGLRPSREAVEAFWGACRRLDREVCGKLPPSDFAAALRATGVLPASGPDGGASTAAALAAGLADGSGLVSYRGLARSLLAQAPQPPPPASAPAARPRPFSAGPGVGVGARSGSAPRTARVQSARPAGPAHAQYGGGEGGRSLLDGPGSTSAGRRSVNWAPELSSMAGCAQGQGQAAAPGYQEQQARPHTPPQLQQEPQRQPAGPSTVTARIHLGGGGAGASPGQTAGGSGAVSSAPSPPPEREWRPPTPPHASHHPTPPTPQRPAPHATSAPPPGVLPGAGAGPNWPPAPPPDPYQKRPSSAIALSCGGTPPREAADTTFFPFKATPYWFGGSTVGAAGGGDMAGPGGPGEAARAYQPSGDHTAGLLGRGHLRSTLPGANSVCVDPAQEAAILGRTGSGLGGSSRGRPASALGGSGAGSTAMYRQLHQEGPPLYSAAVDPAAATGSSLKGPAAAAFAAMRTQPSGPRMTGAPRPVSAPRASTARASSARAGGAGGGGGGSSVGSRALEASMLRETIAAVRSLY